MGTWGTWNNVQGHGTMDMVMGNTSIFPSGDIVEHCWTTMSPHVPSCPLMSPHVSPHVPSCPPMSNNFHKQGHHKQAQWVVAQEGEVMGTPAPILTRARTEETSAMWSSPAACRAARGVVEWYKKDKTRMQDYNMFDEEKVMSLATTKWTPPRVSR